MMPSGATGQFSPLPVKSGQMIIFFFSLFQLQRVWQYPLEIFPFCDAPAKSRIQPRSGLQIWSSSHRIPWCTLTPIEKICLKSSAKYSTLTRLPWRSGLHRCAKDCARTSRVLHPAVSACGLERQNRQSFSPLYIWECLKAF